MKSNLVRASILVLSAAAVYAQSLGPMKVNIPFGFTANGVNLAAGSYSVETRNPTVVTLRSSDARNSVMVGAGLSQSLDRGKDGRLVFHRYGNQYFLADIWMTDSNYGRHIPMSKQERRLAQRQAEPGDVIVASIR